MAKIIGNPVGVPNPKTDWNQENESKANVVLNKPTKLSQFENDTQFVTDKHMHKTTDIATTFLEDGSVDATLADTLSMYNQNLGDLYPRVFSLEDNKADKEHGHEASDISTSVFGASSIPIDNALIYLDDNHNALVSKYGWVEDALMYDVAYKTKIQTSANTSYTFDFSDNHNKEVRLTAPSAISIKFVDTEYAYDYISGLSFNCGDTPTGFDYTASGIINWVGTDCTKDGDLSIFQPSANTHYDIVFYFNGSQFIGLVNGFVPATGNVVSV